MTLSDDKTRAAEKSKRLESWNVWRRVPLPSAIVKEISSDLIFRMSGSGGHIFSVNYSGDLGKFITNYNIDTSKRTLVVFTSANDEIDALEELSKAMGDNFKVKDAFKNQLDWIRYIIEYAGANNVQVIIKMHPRLSSSHRDSGVAEDIHLYKKLSDAAPSNVFFIWPEDKVSAYDILQLADLCLTSWGTMGLEAAKLGVPVVSGITKLTFATPHLAIFEKAETVDQFYEMITREPRVVNIKDVIEAFRWHHLLHISGSIIVNGERDVDLYNEEFNLTFADVLQGSAIVNEKYNFLTDMAQSSAGASVETELHAVKGSMVGLIDFFNNNKTIESEQSKLIARLKQFSEN